MIKKINDIMMTSDVHEGTVILNGDPNRPDMRGLLMRIGKKHSRDEWVDVSFDDLSDDVDMLIPSSGIVYNFFAFGLPDDEFRVIYNNRQIKIPNGDDAFIYLETMGNQEATNYCYKIISEYIVQIGCEVGKNVKGDVTIDVDPKKNELNVQIMNEERLFNISIPEFSSKIKDNLILKTKILADQIIAKFIEQKMETIINRPEGLKPWLRMVMSDVNYDE